LRIAELGYGQGVITLIDYQDTDLGLHQAEILHIQAVYSYLIAEAKLRAAMGES
jgi:outer membrane protein TolC